MDIDPNLPPAEQPDPNPNLNSDPNPEPHPEPEMHPRPAAHAEEEYRPPEKPALTIVIQSWATPILALLMLVIGLVVGFAGRPLVEGRLLPTAILPVADSAAAPTSAVANDAARQQMMADVIKQTVHFMGSQNAPVTIVEFSDFQCPYCGMFARDTQDALIQQYVQSGKVRFGYSHFSFLGQESLDAAEASECAADQNKFWEYHDLLFANQNGENKGAFVQENLVGFADKLNLDKEAFTKCLTSHKYLTLIQSQTQFAGSNGLSSTPSFLVNGYLVKGAQDITTFKQVIDSLLNN